MKASALAITISGRCHRCLACLARNKVPVSYMCAPLLLRELRLTSWRSESAHHCGRLFIRSSLFAINCTNELICVHARVKLTFPCSASPFNIEGKLSVLVCARAFCLSFHTLLENVSKFYLNLKMFPCLRCKFVFVQKCAPARRLKCGLLIFWKHMARRCERTVA